VFSCGVAIIYTVLQDLIFNLNSIGKRYEEKIIFIPKNIVLPKMVNDFDLTNYAPNQKDGKDGVFSNPDKLKE